MVNQFKGSAKAPPQFTRGYGLVFGQSERKAMAMALCDRALRAGEFGEDVVAAAQDEEFVIAHSDNVQATGFVEHLKLPHYVDFQAELDLVAHARRAAARRADREAPPTRRVGGRRAGRGPVRISRCGRTTRSPAKDQFHLVHSVREAACSNVSVRDIAAYNFAYLDEQTKRMIRRAILKAIAIPGYQVPFASREMPMPYGWGTGGVQVTASIIGPDDVLKVIDQGADDTTNAVSIRAFFAKVANVATTTETAEATIIQTRHRIPETPLKGGQTIVFQVPIPEPLRFLEPRETETRKMHALEEYGLMHVKLYEDIARHGHIATTYAYPVKVEGRYVMDPSPMPKFDNPKMHRSPALQLFGAGREKRIYALPPFTMWSASTSRTIRSRSRASTSPARCAAPSDVYLDEVVLDDRGGRMFVCSDTDHCETRRAAGSRGGSCGEDGGASGRRCFASPTRPIGPPPREGELGRGAMTDEPLLRVKASRNSTARRVGCEDVTLRSLAGRGAGGGRRVRLRQDDAAQLPFDAAGADLGHGPLPHARRRVPRPLPDERGRAPLPDADRLGFRSPEPGRRPAHDAFRPAPMSASG